MRGSRSSIPIVAAVLALAGGIVIWVTGRPETDSSSEPSQADAAPVEESLTPPPPERGAAVPFVTIEVESDAARTTGRVVRLSGLPKATDASPELEASGRAFVELDAAGQFVEFQATMKANALVVRHCIPDAPEGGGMDATLSLYVNGEHRQDLELTSTHTWLYGNGEVGNNGQSNEPNDHPHVFWDETRAFIAGGLARGDTLRLQKDATDNAAYYRIDLLEPEYVPPPLSPPEGALSIVEFGATPDDQTVDSDAIAECVDAARARNVAVFIPKGTFLQDRRIDLQGVKVHGAGMWYSTLRAAPTDRPRSFGMHVGFTPSGTGAAVTDLAIEGTDTSRGGGQMAFTGTGSGWTIRNVWMTHLNVGLWMAGEDAIVAGCRVRMTYADGININNGKTFFARRIVVENNHLRGTGDDSIAILAHEHSPDVTTGIIVRHNTACAPWWAHCFDMAGGTGHLAEDNHFADAAQFAGVTINLPGAYPMYPQGEAIIRRNDIIRCGGNFAWQRRGAIWIYPGSTTVSGVRFEENRIVDAVFRAIHITGSHEVDVAFTNTTIESPGEDAVHIDGNASGHLVLRETGLTGLGDSRVAVRNDAKAKFTVEQTGNSWQTGSAADTSVGSP